MNKLTNSATKLGLTAAIAVLASVNGFGQFTDITLYSNVSNSSGAVYNVDNGVEVGDQIGLDAQGKALGYNIKGFSFETFGSGLGAAGSSDAKAQLRFYSAGSSAGTDVQSLELITAAFEVADGYQTHSIAIPEDGGSNYAVGAEGSFFWTVEFSNIPGGASAGLTLSDPPTVGSSFNDYLENANPGNVNTVEFKQFTDGSAANFSAVALGDLTVPEPTVLSLGVVGGLAFLRMRRRK